MTTSIAQRDAPRVASRRRPGPPRATRRARPPARTRIPESLATSPCLRCASSCASTARISAGFICSSSVSYRTTRRVAPKPDTYAFDFVVRRLASATSTSRNRNANPLGQPAQVGCELLVLERLELVEDRLEHDRCDEGEEDDEDRDERCGDERPGVGPRASATSPKSKDGGEQGRDGEPLRDVQRASFRATGSRAPSGARARSRASTRSAVARA